MSFYYYYYYYYYYLCFLIQQLPAEAPQDAHLKPPPLGKQYLISPPASPPLDWEVMAERTPALNYDLINAIAAMGPGAYILLVPQHLINLILLFLAICFNWKIFWDF